MREVGVEWVTRVQVAAAARTPTAAAAIIIINAALYVGPCLVNARWSGHHGRARACAPMASIEACIRIQSGVKSAAVRSERRAFHLEIARMPIESQDADDRG